MSAFWAACEKLKFIDLFGQKVRFEIGGRESLNSYLGTLFSILIGAVMLFYSVMRFQVMLKYDDTVH